VSDMWWPYSDSLSNLFLAGMLLSARSRKTLL
jgi:hypothetical protein